MKSRNFENLKLYPHLKLTAEKFPRLLATRIIEDDRAEYFGAFLPKSGARMLLDFVNKTFRLRSCEIEIDGEFLYPCPMFYRKRCLAPCVEKICDEENYRESVELLRLFLRNEREVLKDKITLKIERLSEAFEFEKAAGWRDFLFEIEKVWKNKRWQYWLGGTVDSWEIKRENAGDTFVFLVTQRGRKILGRRAFLSEEIVCEKDWEILQRIFSEFYKVYRPKEIRFLGRLTGKEKIEKFLSNRFGEKIRIKEELETKATTGKALRQTKFELEFSRISYRDDLRTIQKSLKKIFRLKKMPEKIEAYDVAHISGTDPVAAKVLWSGGEFKSKESEVWHFEEISEPGAFTLAIEDRFARKKSAEPDLILIDGGKTQIKAALEGVRNLKMRKFKFISAVKPAGRHDRIEYFLDENLERIEIEETAAFNFLLKLRDQAHNLANQTHAVRRDTNHFYELAETLPRMSETERKLILQKTGSIKALKNADLNFLQTEFGVEKGGEIFESLQQKKSETPNRLGKLVPIRFDAPAGDAEDLQPIDRYHL